jgi:hypothetical protein
MTPATPLIAYHNDPAEKAAILAQLQAHRDADELVKGKYWQNGKGCAVGCTIHGSDHMLYESLFGIPVMLARLEDRIFEGLPNDRAKEWPIQFMSAIRPGADLSLVGWKFLHWLMTDGQVNPGINHPTVKAAVAKCADLIRVLADGGQPGRRERLERRRERQKGAAWFAAQSAAQSATVPLMAEQLIKLLEAT